MDFLPSMMNLAKGRQDDDDKSTSSDGTVEEPTETEQRYAALRNHQIRFADAIDPNAEKVYKLRKKDIVFGRGRGFQNHPGNERMRDIIEKYKTQYHSLNRDGKRKLVEAVHAEITKSGARFLKKLDGQNVWVVVDLPIALQKVSHTMRCRKSIIRQLDENGNVPNPMGRMPVPARAGALPGMASLAGMPGSSAIPGMPSASAMPGMPSASAMPGMPPGAGMHGMGAAAGIPGMPPGMPPPPPPGAAGLAPLGPPSLYPPGAAGPTDSSLAALEAQRMAALHRYRVLSGMAVARQGDIEYYQQLRRDQLLRETRMLQQMGDAALLGPSSPPAVPSSATMGVPGAAAGLPSAAAPGRPATMMPAIVHPPSVHPPSVHPPTAHHAGGPAAIHDGAAAPAAAPKNTPPPPPPQPRHTSTL